MITATVNDSQVSANIQNIQTSLNTGLIDDNLLKIAHELLRLSQMEVPHDEGTLQNSGTVEAIDGEVVVGYHEKYAARLHEHPEYRFQKGRKGKYLEDPIKRNEDALNIKFAKGIGDDLDKAIK